MNNNPLVLIEDFTETLSTIFKNFTQICRAHTEKMKEARPEYVRIESEIVQERKRRMELQKIVRQRMVESTQNEKPADSPGMNVNWKRPKSGFHLFLMEEQERIAREHPGLDLHKVATLATIKWNHLKKEQQLPYQKKVQEMNKISDDQLAQATQKLKASNDACYIKKEYTYQDEAQNDQEATYQQQNENQEHKESKESHQRYESQEQNGGYSKQQPENRRGDQEQKKEKDNNQRQQVIPNNIDNQNTQMIDNQYESQPTLQMEEAARETNPNEHPSPQVPEEPNEEHQANNE